MFATIRKSTDDVSRGSNVALIVDAAFLVACLAVGIAALGTSRRPRVQGPPQPYRVGDRVEVAGLEFASAERTLALFILDKSTKASTYSYYASLLSTRRSAADARVVVLVTREQGVERAKQRLREAGIVPDGVVAVDISSLRFRAMPTALLVSRSGRLLGIWQGPLDANGERDLAAAFNGG